MGSVGNISATLKGERYNCRARGPHESNFCSQGRCCRHPGCMFVPPWILNRLNVCAPTGHLPSAYPNGLLHVFGANEVTGLRHKPTYDPMQYSVEWANVVTSYLKKQLGDIILPSAPRPTLNIKSVFRSVLADSEARARWISRFTYRYSYPVLDIQFAD